MTVAALLVCRTNGYVNPPRFVSLATSGAAAPQGVTLNVYASNFGSDSLKATINASATAAGTFNPVSGISPWYIAQLSAPTAIWARLTVTAGTSPTSGSAVGSWISIAATSANWTWTRSSAGTTTATVTVELSTDSGGSTIVVTQTGISVSANAT